MAQWRPLWPGELTTGMESSADRCLADSLSKIPTLQALIKLLLFISLGEGPGMEARLVPLPQR